MIEKENPSGYQNDREMVSWYTKNTKKIAEWKAAMKKELIKHRLQDDLQVIPCPFYFSSSINSFPVTA
jgi:hypothetical protein